MHPSSDTDYPDFALGSDDIRDLDAGPSTSRVTNTNTTISNRTGGRGQGLDQINLSTGTTYERPSSGMAGRWAGERRAGAGAGVGVGAGAGPSYSARNRDELPFRLDFTALGRAAAESSVQAEEEENTDERRRPTSVLPRKSRLPRESMERSRQAGVEARGQAARNALAPDAVPISRLPRGDNAERVREATRLAGMSGTATSGNRPAFNGNGNGEADAGTRRTTRVVYPNESEEEEEEDDPDFLPGQIEPDLPPVVRNRYSRPIVLEGNEEEEEHPVGSRAGPSSNGSRLPVVPAPASRATRSAPGSSAARLIAEQRAAQRRREMTITDWQRELSGVDEEDRAPRGVRFAAEDRNADPPVAAGGVRAVVPDHPRRIHPPGRSGEARRRRDMLDRDEEMEANEGYLDNAGLAPGAGRQAFPPGAVPAAPGRAGFASAAERAEAEEAYRISRQLDRQEAAAARQVNPPPRGGLGAGGAEAYGIEPRMVGGAARGGWVPPLPGLFDLGDFAAWRRGMPGLGGILPNVMAMGLDAMAPPRWRVPAPSIEDMWKGINYVGHRDSPQPGYTFDFDRENNEAGAGPTDVIRLDTDEDSPWTQDLAQDVVERKHSKPHLVCAKCQAPLRVSEGMRNEDDRVFALSCGHVVDAKCYEKISRPEAVIIPDEVLGGETVTANGHSTATPTEEADDGMATGSKRKRKAAAPAAAPPVKKATRGRPAKAAPEEYTWNCPVGERCGRTFKSVKRGGVWMPDPGAATQLFV